MRYFKRALLIYVSVSAVQFIGGLCFGVYLAIENGVLN